MCNLSTEAEQGFSLNERLVPPKEKHSCRTLLLSGHEICVDRVYHTRFHMKVIRRENPLIHCRIWPSCYTRREVQLLMWNDPLPSLSLSAASCVGPTHQWVQRQAEYAASLPEPSAPGWASHASERYLPWLLPTAATTATSHQSALRSALTHEQLPKLPRQQCRQQCHLPPVPLQLRSRQPLPDARWDGFCCPGN